VIEPGDAFTCGDATHAHVACKTCLQHHIKARVEEGMLLMTCPIGYDECGYELTESEISTFALPADVEALDALKPTPRKRWGCFVRKEHLASEPTQKAEPAMARFKCWWRKTTKTKGCKKCRMRIEKNGAFVIVRVFHHQSKKGFVYTFFLQESAWVLLTASCIHRVTVPKKVKSCRTPPILAHRV